MTHGEIDTGREAYTTTDIGADHEIVLTEEALVRGRNKCEGQDALDEVISLLRDVRVRRWVPKVCGECSGWGDKAIYQGGQHTGQWKKCNHCHGTGKEPCPACAKGEEPIMLDRNGTLCSVSGLPGDLGHGADDWFWFCKDGHAGERVEKRLRVVDEDGNDV